MWNENPCFVVTHAFLRSSIWLNLYPKSGDVEDTIEQRVTDVAAVNAKILENISVAKQKQKKELRVGRERT